MLDSMFFVILIYVPTAFVLAVTWCAIHSKWVTAGYIKTGVFEDTCLYPSNCDYTDRNVNDVQESNS